MKKVLRVFLLVFGLSVLGSAQVNMSFDEGDAVGITKLNFATVLVRDYDEALKWYTEVLGFQKIQDQSFGAGHRWIVVAPKDQKEIGIVLAVSRKLSPDDKTIDYMDRLGKETNWVYQAKDVRKLYEQLTKRGVKFVEPPTDEPWGTVQAIFEDLYGNIFVVESPRQRTVNVGSTPIGSGSNDPASGQSTMQGGVQGRPETQRLRFREGVWNVTMEFQPTPRSEKMSMTGVQTNKLSGPWLTSDLEATMNGRPFLGHGVNGYDPSKGKYVGIWVDSTRNYITRVEGTYDASGKIFTTTSMEKDARGANVPLTEVTETVDDNTEITTLWVPGEKKGEKFARIKLTYTRRK
ncbi:MAG TPA: DUF1579 family protein [Pyrinomonadaceae bacterium]|nr:DUF1579 family protein [Pyrinomonadaceae bacterium]